MKTILLFLAASFSLFAQAQANPCNMSYGTVLQQRTSVSSTTTTNISGAVPAGQSVHVCAIKLVLNTASTVQLQGSDGTVIDGPDSLAAGIIYSFNWNGQLSTVAGGAAAGSTLQIKFGTAQSTAVAVTLVYYLAPQ